jgi:two-component system nitrate/nitrite response regulator NarL
MRVLEGVGYDVAGAADTVAAGVDAVEQTAEEPEVVLLDSSLVADDAATTFQLVRQRFPQIQIVVFTDADGTDKALSCFLAGADGCVTKNVSSQAMSNCIDLVTLGERVFPASLIASLIQDPAIGGHRPQVPDIYGNLCDPATAQLSKRERHILAALAVGRSNKQIAEENELTEATVKVHLRNILRKIQASNRTQAAIWAITHNVSEAAQD